MAEDGITGEPTSTITDIDLARCGLIKAHLAYHRNEHGRADIDYHRYRHRPMWVNRGSFGIPSHILPFRAGIADFGYCDSLRYSSVGPPLLFGRCYSQSPLCPPSTLSGWGQACGPPPHYLSTTAYPSAYNLPFRAGTPRRAFSDTLRYAAGDAKISPLRALPPL